MPEPLKNEFNERFVLKLANSLNRQDESFDINKFHASIFDQQWEQRELKDRMRHISLMIRQHTVLNYLQQLKIMVSISDQFGGLVGKTFPDFVEVHGLNDVKESLDALGHFTQFSSSEFAIRPFLLAHEKITMNRMKGWCKDSNEHLRRLSSEGCRPRLPWAMSLPKYKKDPVLVIAILNNLKKDESLYVRKSVANNLNDITKDNPELALQIAKEWYGEDEKTNWIVKHGLRTLLKKGNEKALEIIGFNFKAKFHVTNLTLSKRRLSIGETLGFSFSIQNLEKQSSYAKVGFVVSYVKANGNLSDKIFHVAEKEFAVNSHVSFTKKLSVKNLSTRKHYPGEHQIAVVVNGQKLMVNTFELSEKVAE